MPARFTTHRTRRGHYYFVLESSRNDILLTSDPFVFRVSCLNAIDAVRTVSPDPSHYSEGQATNGEYFFVLRGADREILARSEFFTAIAWMHATKECVMQEAPDALLTETL
jgi:uncharacterized protein YegP (UPF0339 family)